MPKCKYINKLPYCPLGRATPRVKTEKKIDNTVDRKNFIVKKVTWDKSLTRFNFVKAESIVCMSTEELCC